MEVEADPGGLPAQTRGLDVEYHPELSPFNRPLPSNPAASRTRSFLPLIVCHPCGSSSIQRGLFEMPSRCIHGGGEHVRMRMVVEVPFARRNHRKGWPRDCQQIGKRRRFAAMVRHLQHIRVPQRLAIYYVQLDGFFGVSRQKESPVSVGDFEDERVVVLR